MERYQALKLMAVLSAHYPKVNLPEETVNLWVSYLLKYDKDLVAGVFAQIARTSKWFPSWAEVYELITRGDNPTTSEAWAVAVAKGGVGCPELVQEAVNKSGGDYAFRASSGAALNELKGRFTEVYGMLLKDFRQEVDKNGALPKPYDIRLLGSGS